MTKTVPELPSSYHDRVTTGVWKYDPAQEKIVRRLQRLNQELFHYSSRRNSQWLGQLLTKSRDSIPAGLYMYGGVGRGKTALMDLLYDNVQLQEKYRVHFHTFMLDIHARLHTWRQSAKEQTDNSDPIKPVAKAFSKGITLLCIDEFQVNDVADAMILRRLFSIFFQNNIVIIMTSNTAPDALYADGLNRDQFMPFIDLLKSNLDITHLSGLTDFRLLQLQQAPVYFSPLGNSTDTGLDSAFEALTQGATPEQHNIRVKGRSITVSASACGVARFNFVELCERPLGAIDYVEVARRYHTIIVSGIPRFHKAQRDEASRFIKLIDILYEHRVNLICGAAGKPNELCSPDTNLAAFNRTASRLEEMRSTRYLSASHIL